MQKHWRTYPPVHIMAALWAGYKPPASEADFTKPAKVSRADEVKTMQFAADMPALKIVRPR